jgi:hypothetical protein
MESYWNPEAWQMIRCIKFELKKCSERGRGGLSSGLAPRQQEISQAPCNVSYCNDITLFFLTFTHLSLGIAYRRTPHSSQIVPSAVLALTVLGDTSSTFPLVTGRTTKGVCFSWLDNLKFSKNTHNITESR